MKKHLQRTFVSTNEALKFLDDNQEKITVVAITEGKLSITVWYTVFTTDEF